MFLKFHTFDSRKHWQGLLDRESFLEPDYNFYHLALYNFNKKPDEKISHLLSSAAHTQHSSLKSHDIFSKVPQKLRVDIVYSLGYMMFNGFMT